MFSGISQYGNHEEDKNYHKNFKFGEYSDDKIDIKKIDTARKHPAKN